ncbi:5072_t:CDS:2, partial [Funneliformis geosporum]
SIERINLKVMQIMAIIGHLTDESLKRGRSAKKPKIEIWNQSETFLMYNLQHLSIMRQVSDVNWPKLPAHFYNVWSLYKCFNKKKVILHDTVDVIRFLGLMTKA